MWNRGLVWSEHDARHRTRDRAALTIGIVAVLLVILGMLNFSCFDLMFPDDEGMTLVHVRVPAGPQDCAADADCVLIPARVTCCGECEPVPPFEAAPLQILVDLRSACVPQERLCDPPVCTAPPAGCEARAACREGRCEVIANDRCTRR